MLAESYKVAEELLSLRREGVVEKEGPAKVDCLKQVEQVQQNGGVLRIGGQAVLFGYVGGLGEALQNHLRLHPSDHHQFLRQLAPVAPLRQAGSPSSHTRQPALQADGPAAPTSNLSSLCNERALTVDPVQGGDNPDTPVDHSHTLFPGDCLQPPDNLPSTLLTSLPRHFSEHREKVTAVLLDQYLQQLWGVHEFSLGSEGESAAGQLQVEHADWHFVFAERDPPFSIVALQLRWRRYVVQLGGAWPGGGGD